MSAPAGIWGQAWADTDDSALLAMVRVGDPDAYAELWRRHLPAAYGVAHRHRGRTSAEDVVAEASLRVYGLIRAGKGPSTNFRSYFLSTVKTVGVDHARADLRAVPTADADLDAASPATAAYDPSPSVDQEMVRAAFRRLPERDRVVLWRTAVEGTSPAAVAATMGITANGVSVLALRARDSLRARYLDAHADRAIARADDEECRWVLSQMGRFVRGKLPVRQKARVEEHLRTCPHAQGLAYELADVNRALPAVMVPLIFMAGSAAATAWAGVLGSTATGSDGGGRAQDPTGSMTTTFATLGSKAAALVVAVVLAAGYAVNADGVNGGGVGRGGVGGGGIIAGGSGGAVGPGGGTDVAAPLASPTAVPSAPSSTTTTAAPPLALIPEAVTGAAAATPRPTSA
ncbi:MAG: sigma-70 family RNA polymerase sigma factor, partial [Candidatus Phosphoribacter sp.]